MALATLTASLTAQDATAPPRGQGVAGENFNAGAALYLKAADTKLYGALNDTAPHAAFVGFALNGGVAGQPVFYHSLGLITLGVSVLVAGETYCVSGTAGRICPIADVTAGLFVSIIGVAASVAQLNVTPIVSGIAHG